MLFAFVPDPSLHWFLELCSLALRGLNFHILLVFRALNFSALTACWLLIFLFSLNQAFNHNSLLGWRARWTLMVSAVLWTLYKCQLTFWFLCPCTVALTCTKLMCFSGYITSDVKNYWVMRCWTNLSQLPTEHTGEGNQWCCVFAMLLRKHQNPCSSQGSVTMPQTAQI